MKKWFEEPDGLYDIIVFWVSPNIITNFSSILTLLSVNELMK
jgi:hypothetical protein